MEITNQTQGGNIRPLLLTTKEVAKMLGVSHRTLEDWRLRGGGPAFIYPRPRMPRYQMADLIAFLDRPTFTNTAQALAA